MFRYLLFPLLLILSLISCDEAGTNNHLVEKDTVAPVIRLQSPSVENVLLQVSSTTLISNGASSYTLLPGKSTGDYVDEGVSILDEVDGELKCVNLPLETTGSVNNKMIGEYILTYNTQDAAGNKAIPVTRKVRVIENEVAFINGVYDAICTCTALPKDSKTSVLSKSEYTSYVGASYEYNKSFDLDHLRIGDYDVRPTPVNVEGNSLEVHFYDPAFDMSGNASTGTLSASKNSFTIETNAYLYSPITKYTCRSIFKKQTN